MGKIASAAISIAGNGPDESGDPENRNNRADRFFAALAQFCRVDRAAEQAGLTEAEARALLTSPDHADRASAALAAAYRALEWEMLYRARFGSDDPKKYNDPHGLRMLIRHRADAAAAGKAASPVTTKRLDEITARLKAKLDARERDEGADDQPG